MSALTEYNPTEFAAIVPAIREFLQPAMQEAA